MTDTDALGQHPRILDTIVDMGAYEYFDLVMTTPPSGRTNTWTSIPGFLYQLQGTVDLPAQAWVNIGNVVTASTTSVTLGDTADLDYRLYRAVETPPN
jgi:hypothetical protein